MSRTILVLLSEHGYWGEELVGPLAAFDEQGWTTVFATPTGKRAHALPPILDPGYVDPPLGRSVTTAEVAVAASRLDESDRLDHPLALSEWIPERPYTSEDSFLRKIEAYYRELSGVEADLERY